ncbi:MAG: EAL domain-containing protein [Clostridia bacterium]|nr:EAL domain-containing protein [Clostridia bacterium]
MDYLLSRHFISLFLILLFAIRLSSQKSTRDKELRYFWMTVISCFLLVVEDQLEMMASEDPSLKFWRILLSVAGYFLRSTATIGLLFAAVKPTGVRKTLWWLPAIINLLICCTAFFSDIAFGYDADYNFYRGPLGYVAFIVPIFYLYVILFATFRRYGKGGNWTESLILIICAVLCLLSALLDSTRGGVRLHEAIMISSIFFYLFLRSYDVRRDALTSVLNRQSLYDDCKSIGKSISAVASLDMNGLKAMNDRQGHQAGDEALKRIGRCLQEVSGENVRSYRIGGDEFVILFSHVEEAFVRETLETLREKITDAGYSIACGYAMREGKEDPDSLIRRSDMKMFEHKAQYYREKQHDRRRARSENPDRYPADIRRALEAAPEPLAVYEFSDHRVETLVLSEGFCRLFGYPDREQALHVLDQDMYTDIHPDDRERFSGAMLRFVEGTEELDLVYRARGGMESGYRVVHARGSHMHSGTSARIAHVWYMDEGVYVEGDEESGTLMNQTLNRALHEESIVNAAHYDELTGLPSLTWFFTLCEAWKSKVLSEGENPVLLYIDLAGMRYYNHKYGFAEGDRLLKAFAETLLQAFGKENTCHVSADCFAASTKENGLEGQLKALFEKAAGINGGNSLPVKVGIYSFGLENVSTSTAFDRAKTACGTIRQHETSAFSYFRLEMRDAFKKEQYIISNIDKAIQEKWVKVYYQPIVSAANGTVCDEEALARWIDPVEGFLSPGEFIPYLENAGKIYKLDLFMLEQSLEKIKLQQEAGVQVVPVSINLSRSDFLACDIVEEIRKRVEAAGVDPGLISVEITESVIGSDFEFMNEQVNRFRKNGFKVWMDDFGSGYSSLDVLQSIDFDLIKFDMSFTRKLDDNENCRVILTELMRMAQKLKKDTICEGIEKEEHVRFLKEIGCSKLQGYYFSKPVPFDPESLRTAGNPQSEES